MTVAGIPVSPVMEALRSALADHDVEYGVTARWSPPHDSIIDAARAVLNEYDTQVAAVRALTDRAAEQHLAQLAELARQGHDAASAVQSTDIEVIRHPDNAHLDQLEQLNQQRIEPPGTDLWPYHEGGYVRGTLDP